ncbi:MAG: hypothetical protein ACRDPK_02025 [Carbonactinosporaceae bacterium]
MTTFDYDMRGLMVRRVVPHDPSGPGPDTRVTEFVYDEVGNRTAVVSPRGTATPGVADDFTTRFVYDELNRVTSRLFGYDPGDGEINTQDAADQVDYTYDQLGNLTQVSAPASADNPAERAETTFDYFDNGWVASSVDPWECLASSIWLSFLAVNVVSVDLAGGSRRADAGRGLRVGGCG